MDSALSVWLSGEKTGQPNDLEKLRHLREERIEQEQ